VPSDAPLKQDLSVDLVGERKGQDRRAQDRPVTEDRTFSDAERLEMFQRQLYNDALPDLPPIAGYHLCWLTTTNKSDTIHKRVRIGYEPVRPDEVPELGHAVLTTGEYAGMIAVNEMLAYKIRTPLYETYMNEVHHIGPRQDEEKLNALVDRLRREAEEVGGTLVEGDGMSDLRARTPQRGIFAP
jgi:hypothetical protein